MRSLTYRVKEALRKYPYRSQENVNPDEVVISVKLFDIHSDVRWWLSEYDAENRIAFGYVTGFVEDEWGAISLDELEAFKF